MSAVSHPQTRGPLKSAGVISRCVSCICTFEASILWPSFVSRAILRLMLCFTLWRPPVNAIYCRFGGLAGVALAGATRGRAPAGSDCFSRRQVELRFPPVEGHRHEPPEDRFHAMAMRLQLQRARAAADSFEGLPKDVDDKVGSAQLRAFSGLGADLHLAGEGPRCHPSPRTKWFACLASLNRSQV